jgi:hypothetical protein
VLKPELPGVPGSVNEPLTVNELEVAVKSANDKERLIGLLAAPLAAIIGILVVSSLIANDAPAIKNGKPNPLHTSVAIYQELFLVVVVLSILMLVMAWRRKRTFLGIVMALYGLTIFNLHFWGFGVPFIFAAAWYLVRAYRLQRDLKEAGGDVPGRGMRRGTTASNLAPRPNKRYTPPSSSRRWSTKPSKEPRVG